MCCLLLRHICQGCLVVICSYNNAAAAAVSLALSQIQYILQNSTSAPPCTVLLLIREYHPSHKCIEDNIYLLLFHISSKHIVGKILYKVSFCLNCKMRPFG